MEVQRTCLRIKHDDIQLFIQYDYKISLVAFVCKEIYLHRFLANVIWGKELKAF